jgi:hypothetical protein
VSVCLFVLCGPPAVFWYVRQVRHLELPGREDLRKLQLLREEQGELSAGDESRLRRLQRVGHVLALVLMWMRHARPRGRATLSLAAGDLRSRTACRSRANAVVTAPWKHICTTLQLLLVELWCHMPRSVMSAHKTGHCLFASYATPLQRNVCNVPLVR